MWVASGHDFANWQGKRHASACQMVSVTERCKILCDFDNVEKWLDVNSTASQREEVTADPLDCLGFQAWRFLLVPCGLFKIWPEVLICNLLKAPLWTWINTGKYKPVHSKMLFSLFCCFSSNRYSISKELWSCFFHSLYMTFTSSVGHRNPWALRGNNIKASAAEATENWEWSGPRAENLRSEQFHVSYNPHSPVLLAFFSPF